MWNTTDFIIDTSQYANILNEKAIIKKKKNFTEFKSSFYQIRLFIIFYILIIFLKKVQFEIVELSRILLFKKMDRYRGIEVLKTPT
jgi:hypothetical protein